VANPRPDRPTAPPDDLDSAEEAVEEAVEFFSPDEKPPSDDQLTRFPPDENKRD